MRKWLLSLVYTALLFFCFSANEASATATATTTSYSNVSTATSWCFGLIGMSGSGGGAGGSGINGQQGIVAPLIQCFTDTARGIIPSVTTAFIAKTRPTYLATLGVIFLLAIAFYGVRIFTGDVKRLKSETIILGLKLAGIILFIDNAGSIYLEMVNIMQQLSQQISKVATTVHSSGFCTGNGRSASNQAGGGAASSSTNDLWQRWDCVFSYLLGFSQTGFAAAGIAAFLLLMFFSMSNGIMIFFLGLYLIIWLLRGVFKFIHIYLMSVLSLSFLFCIGYMFVPMLLFKNTFQYFTKWLTMVFGFILTPVIMFGFMAMMLVAIDIALFSGQYSVFCSIGGSSACGTKTSGGAAIFSNLTQNVDVKAEKSNGNPNLNNSLKDMLYVALDGLQSMNSGSGSGAPGCNSLFMGLEGFGCSMQGSSSGAVAGDAYENAVHPTAARLGFDQTVLNLSNMATSIGSTCTLTGSASGGVVSGGSYYSNCPYVENILISLLVASLLVYLMVALADYIPALATNLTGDSFGKDIASTGVSYFKEVVGEKGMMGALNMGKDAAMGAAQGLSSGGTMGAVRNVASILSGNRGGGGGE